LTNLREILRSYVDNGTIPGGVALRARGEHIELAAVGTVDADGTAPMARDTIFRLASITKQVVAAAVMMLVEDGRIALDEPIGKWLPELASPVVVRTPGGPVDDVVPTNRPITVFDLLTSRAGHGFPSDFDLPVIQVLLEEGQQKHGRAPRQVVAPDDWMEGLSNVPLVYQPGQAWLYNTCSDIQGVLIARVAGRPLPDFLAERVFEPLGMIDTGFFVPAAKIGRFTSYYHPDGAGGLDLADPPGGEWSTPPRFPSGAGGLVSTADDWLAFARLLLRGGTIGGTVGGTVGGRRLLSEESVRLMTVDHLTQGQRDASHLFLERQGWGFGAAVDVSSGDPWNVPGRYWWTGGTGTTASLTPASDTVSLLLTQVAMTGPTPTRLMRDVWTYAAQS